MEDDFTFEPAQGGNPDDEQDNSESMESTETPSELPPPTQNESVMPRRTSSDGGSVSSSSQMPRRTSSEAPHTPLPPSEATNQWKAANEKRVKEKDAEATKIKKEMTKKAEQTLEHAKQERTKKIAQTAKANREAQAKAQASSNSKTAVNAPPSWTKIASLVDLEKDGADRERFRAVLQAKASEGKA